MWPLAGLLLLGLTAWLALAWLLRSEAGAAWLLARVSAEMDSAFTVHDIEGSLGDHLVLDRVVLSGDGFSTTIPRVELRASIGLFPTAVQVHALDLGAIEVHLMDSQESSEADWVANITGMRLPFPLSLKDVSAGPVLFLGEERETLMQLDKVSLSAEWFENLDELQAQIQVADLRISIEGALAFDDGIIDSVIRLDTWNEPFGAAGVSAANLEARLRGTPYEYEYSAESQLGLDMPGGRV